MKRIALGTLTAAILAFAASDFAVAKNRVGVDLPGNVILAQANGHRLFIDSRRRHFLFDRQTGEIIGRANRNARMTRRDKARAQRELDRALRRDRRKEQRTASRRKLRQERRREQLRDELGGLFGLFERRRALDVPPKTPRRESARIPDPEEPIDREPLPSLSQEDELARLPDVDQPIPNAPSVSPVGKPKYNRAKMTALQVYLDRTGFSPGAIDGQWGSNVAKAIQSWKSANGDSGNLNDASTLDRLVAQTGGEVFTTYTITDQDVAGPFVKSVPVDYAKKAELEALSYTSVVEMLAEKFHMSRGYLASLNKGKNFNRAGTVIKVVAPGPKVTRSVHYIVADKGRKQVRAYDRNGNIVTAYPATIGSASTPSPSGSHSVDRIAINPEYTYNPKINFTQGENKEILRIPPGPNGPVGSVWIALSKPTYGIHGTPNPETIGKTNSHGCIRLTNWDALELAKLVRKGVTVEFIE